MCSNCWIGTCTQSQRCPVDFESIDATYSPRTSPDQRGAAEIGLPVRSQLVAIPVHSVPQGALSNEDISGIVVGDGRIKLQPSRMPTSFDLDATRAVRILR